LAAFPMTSTLIIVVEKNVVDCSFSFWRASNCWTIANHGPWTSASRHRHYQASASIGCVVLGEPSENASNRIFHADCQLLARRWQWSAQSLPLPWAKQTRDHPRTRVVGSVLHCLFAHPSLVNVSYSVDCGRVWVPSLLSPKTKSCTRSSWGVNYSNEGDCGYDQTLSPC